MKTLRPFFNEAQMKKSLRSTVGNPPIAAISRSRARLRQWFAQTAPVIQWAPMSTPLGRLFVAKNSQGLCALDFGHGESEFLERLDPQARLEKNFQAVAQALQQLQEYFSGARFDFSLAVDLSSLTPFQRRVLDTACRIPAGQVWTYQQVAETLSRPKSSRPVGQALARNPIPIIIPCHRVIASDGSLGGYSGGSGLKAKRWLLQLEGALS